MTPSYYTKDMLLQVGFPQSISQQNQNLQQQKQIKNKTVIKWLLLNR